MEYSQRERARAHQLRSDIIEISKPFVQLKVDVLNVALPAMVLLPNGQIESTYSDEVELNLKRIELLRLEAVASYLNSHSQT